AGWNPEREIADEIARVYLMPEARCPVNWPGCEGASHRCVRRVGHDGSHRCECGAPWTNGNGNGSTAPARRQWRDRRPSMQEIARTPSADAGNTGHSHRPEQGVALAHEYGA